MGTFLGKIFSSGASKLVDSVGNAIDKNITSKEEASKLKNEFYQLMTDHEYRIESELTERHKADMTSDNKLSKNIRPVTLIVLLTAMIGLVVTDSIEAVQFEVASHWVYSLSGLLVTVTSFYFGGRNKQKSILNKKKNL